MKLERAIIASIVDVIPEVHPLREFGVIDCRSDPEAIHDLVRQVDKLLICDPWKAFCSQQSGKVRVIISGATTASIHGIIVNLKCVHPKVFRGVIAFRLQKFIKDCEPSIIRRGEKAALEILGVFKD